MRNIRRNTMPTGGSQGPFPGPIEQLGPERPGLGPRARTRDVSPDPPISHDYLSPRVAVPSQRAIASLRLPLCSLVKMRLMWFLTVFSLMKHVAAIC